MPSVCVRFWRGEDKPNDLFESIRFCPLNNTDLQASVIVVPKHVFRDIGQRSSGIVISEVQGEAPALAEVANKPLDPLLASLPDNYIFDRHVKCPMCNYSTDIKKNLIRHYNSHKGDSLFDQENDPVNRIPPKGESPKPRKRLLTENNDSFVDTPAKPIKKKMRRMTVSEARPSVTEPPKYVPISQRFRCGVDKCDYVAPEERTLKGHISGVHSDDMIFKCPHCDIVLHGWFDVEVIGTHYKLHDSQLHRCGLCPDFYGDTRFTVSKHIRKRHKASVNQEDIVAIRGLELEARPTPSKPSKIQLVRRNSVSAKRLKMELFKCSYCSFEDVSFDEMLKHCNIVHYHPSQYQCQACKVNLNAEKGFKTHVTMKHHGTKPSLITHFKLVEENEVYPVKPTTPPAEKPVAVVKKPNPVPLKSPQVEKALVIPRTVRKVGNEKDLFAALRLHYRNHTVHRPIVFHCEMCPQTFDDWNRIYEHYKKGHKNSVFNPKLPSYLLYSCLFCSFNTPRAATLADHFTRSHENAMPLYHLDFIVKCMQCDFSNTAEKVKEHYEEKHPKQQPVMRNMVHQTCGLCPYKFNDDKDLAEHFAKTHKQIVNQNLKVKENIMKQLLNVKVDKFFKCKLCKAVLNNNQSRFHEHSSQCVPVEVAHRYRCRKCSFLTMDYEEAKAHINGHKEQSICCEICSLSCSSYDVLLMHLTEHLNAGDYISEMVKLFTLEIIFPNGLVCSESVVAPALESCHYKHPQKTGSEV